MKKIETERTVFILKQDHTLMDSALRMQDMLNDGWQHDFSVQLQYQTLVYLYRNTTESPKPDWVKEEIKEMMRPSDDLLWAAYEAGFIAANRIGGPIKEHGDCKRGFETWSKTIPPDTLKEDRLLIAREVLFTMEFKSNYSEDVISALERLCGMEVGNG